MKFTGERVIPGECDADLFNEHKARYLFALRFAAGKRVLDAACGSGYGTRILAEKARSVSGVDISLEAVEYCRANFSAGNASYSQADCLAMPYPEDAFDLIVAFEIIEHLQDPAAFLRELRRVMAPSGMLILSTPNRQYYTVERGETNPFHQKEFSYPEFDDLLQGFFPHRAILFENHVPALLIEPGNGGSGTAGVAPIAALQDSQGAPRPGSRETAYFFVAICSGQPFDPVAPLLYLPASGNILREREKYIHRLSEYLEEATADRERARQEMERMRQALDERTEWARKMNAELSEKNIYTERLQADYNAKIEWAKSLDADLEHARAALTRLQQEFDERTAWALRLNEEVKERTAQLHARIDDLNRLRGSLWHQLGKILRLVPAPRPGGGPAAAS